MRRTRFRPLLAAAVAFGIAAALAAPVAPALAGSGNFDAKSPHRERGPQLAVPETGGGSLSRRLSRSGGVIHPPPLAGSSMPVIPPPGTPGGNPKIEPK